MEKNISDDIDTESSVSEVKENMPEIVKTDGEEMGHPVIDICVNLAWKRFTNKSRKEMLDRAAAAGVTHIVLCSTNENATKSHLQMVEYNENQNCPVGLIMTAGVHPHDAKEWRRNYSLRVFENTIKNNQDRIRVVGECGLDYDRMFSTVEKQDICFREQIQLAKKLNLPLFLHERKAHRQFVATLNKEIRKIDQLSKDDKVYVNGVIHCFTGNYGQLMTYLRMGLHIGITGWIGDANNNRNSDLVDALKRIGTESDNLSILKERLMIETDTPFLSPTSRRATNEPANVQIVMQKVAEYLNVPLKELAPQIYMNTITFFNL